MSRTVSHVIKICGVTSADDIRAAVDAGATAIGFNFYRRSPRFLTLSQAQTLAEGVPAGIDRVGVFVSPATEELEAAVQSVPLDTIQLHGYVPAPLPASVRIWRALPVKEDFHMEASDPNFEAYLLDTATPLHGGSGRTFNWKLAAAPVARVILAGGLDASNVADAIHTAHPWGVDACSRLESAPGRKDPRRVTAFVEAARAAFEEAAEFLDATLVKETA